MSDQHILLDGAPLRVLLCGEAGEPAGKLSKCCPPGQALGEWLSDCVVSGEGQQPWLPPRLVLSHHTPLPTSHFTQKTAHFPHICHGGTFQERKYFWTFSV